MEKFHFNENTGAASASFDGRLLKVGTGVVERCWRLLPAGLSTESYCYLPTGREWILPTAEAGPDWRITVMAEPDAQATLTATAATSLIDDPGTGDHLAVTLIFRYPETNFLLRYEVRAYPNAPGLWTRLAVRAEDEPERDSLPGCLLGAYCERLAVAAAAAQRRLAVGYYNDTQHRNHDDLPIRREEENREWRGRLESYDWASLLFIENADSGLALVKESHKCVNQRGIDTGAFLVKPDSVTVTGLALTPPDYGGGLWLRTDRWRPAWATWSLLYDGSAEERQLAVKRFDRLRYPFRPERDMFITANTWGSGGAGEGSRSAANQENILREIASCADLGIELLQIDDGWQCEPGAARPFEVDWTPNPRRFPDGWRPVRQAAADTGLRLGLWAPWRVDADSLIRNYREGGFRRFKLDFINLHSRDDLDALLDKVGALIDGTDRNVGINWDATEENARLGYYFGREHGNIYLENRENGPPDSKLTRLCHIRYTPRLVLRDAWHLAHYVNLNQIQLAIQNIDRVVADFSNCREYSHDYCFAIAMMAVPLFFQETHYLDDNARRQLRPIIATYKRHRQAINAGLVFPVGDQPDDASWTGFQSHDADDNSGYLLLFREVYNRQPRHRLPMHQTKSRTICFTDTGDGETWSADADHSGAVEFSLPEAASYRLLHYAFA